MFKNSFFPNLFFAILMVVFGQSQLNAQSCYPYPCAPCTINGTVTTQSTNCGITTSATVTLTSGVGPFTFVIKPANGNAFPPVVKNVPTHTFTGLTPGQYYVWAIDANGCIWTGQCEYVGPLQAAISFESYCGGSNYVCVSAMGGTPPYLYLWSDGYVGLYDGCRYDLPAGNYSVTVTDSATPKCTSITETAHVQNNLNPTIGITKVNPTCGLSNGSFTANITGGASPFSYDLYRGSQKIAFSTSLMSSVITKSGLTPGNYTLYVYDALGCTTQATFALVNSGSPSLFEIDTASCGPIVLFGQTYVQSTTFTLSGFTPQGCKKDTTVTITISDIIIGDTTKIVACENATVQWKDSLYTESGFYQKMETTASGCSKINFLDLKILDANATVVIEEYSCTPKITKIVPSVTSDGCPFDSIFVTHVVSGTTSFVNQNSCDPNAVWNVQHDTTSNGCVNTTVIFPIYVGSPDSTLHLESCDIAFTDSIKIENRVNQFGCEYKFTTTWCVTIETQTKIVPSCLDSLIGTSQVDTINVDGCTVIQTTYFTEGQSSWFVKNPITVCSGSWVQLGNTNVQVLNDTLLHSVGFTSTGCLVDSFQNVSVEYPEKVWTFLTSCNPIFQDSIRFDGLSSDSCPDSLFTAWTIYTLEDVNTSDSTCIDSLMGKTITTTEFTADSCPYLLHTTYFGLVPVSVTEDTLVCFGTTIQWYDQNVSVDSQMVLLHIVELPGGCKEEHKLFIGIKYGETVQANKKTCDLVLAQSGVTFPGQTGIAANGCNSDTLFSWIWDPGFKKDSIEKVCVVPVKWFQTDTIYDPLTNCWGVLNISREYVPSKTTQLNPVVLCPGESLVFEGQMYFAPPAGQSVTLTETYTTAEGCDSVVTQVVTGLPQFKQDTTVYVCKDEEFAYGDQFLEADSTYVFILPANNGECSTVLSITVLNHEASLFAFVPQDTTIRMPIGVTPAQADGIVHGLIATSWFGSLEDTTWTIVRHELFGPTVVNDSTNQYLEVWAFKGPCGQLDTSRIINVVFPKPAKPPVIICDVIVHLVGNDKISINILNNIVDGDTLSKFTYSIYSNAGVATMGTLTYNPLTNDGLNLIPLPQALLGLNMYIVHVEAIGDPSGDVYILVPPGSSQNATSMGICR